MDPATHRTECRFPFVLGDNYCVVRLMDCGSGNYLIIASKSIKLIKILGAFHIQRGSMLEVI